MRWLVDIVPLGSGTAERLCVEASHWQPALKLARELRGEGSELVGLSVEFLEDGCRVLDPTTRLRYTVRPAPEDEPLSHKPSVSPPPPARSSSRPGARSSAPPPARSSAPPPSEPVRSGSRPSAPQLELAPSSPGPRFRTLAFSSPGTATTPGPDSEAPSRQRMRTSAFASVGEAHVTEPPPGGIEGSSESAGPAAQAEAGQAVESATQSDVLARQSEAPAHGGPLSASVDETDETMPSAGAEQTYELVSSRSIEPTADSPLTYREYVFGLHRPLPDDQLEAFARARLVEVRQALADVPEGRVVNIAVFDHVFHGVPSRPPVVTLSWKDWRADGAEVALYPYGGGSRIAKRDVVAVPPQPLDRRTAGATDRPARGSSDASAGAAGGDGVSGVAVLPVIAITSPGAATPPPADRRASDAAERREREEAEKRAREEAERAAREEREREEAEKRAREEAERVAREEREREEAEKRAREEAERAAREEREREEAEKRAREEAEREREEAEERARAEAERESKSAVAVMRVVDVGQTTHAVVRSDRSAPAASADADRRSPSDAPHQTPSSPPAAGPVVPSDRPPDGSDDAARPEGVAPTDDARDDEPTAVMDRSAIPAAEDDAHPAEEAPAAAVPRMVGGTIPEAATSAPELTYRASNLDSVLPPELEEEGLDAELDEREASDQAASEADASAGPDAPTAERAAPPDEDIEVPSDRPTSPLGDPSLALDAPAELDVTPPPQPQEAPPESDMEPEPRTRRRSRRSLTGKRVASHELVVEGRDVDAAGDAQERGGKGAARRDKSPRSKRAKKDKREKRRQAAEARAASVRAEEPRPNDVKPDTPAERSVEQPVAAPPAPEVVAAPAVEPPAPTRVDVAAGAPSPVVGADAPAEERARALVPKPASPGLRLVADELLTDLFEVMAELPFIEEALDGADFVLAQVLERLPCEIGVLSLFDMAHREYLVVRQIGGARSGLLSRLPQRAKLPSKAMRIGRAVIVHESAGYRDSVDRRWEQMGVVPRSLLCAPLELEGRFVGLIELANPQNKKPFTETDGHALSYVGQQLAEFVAARGVVVEPEEVLEGLEADLG